MNNNDVFGCTTFRKGNYLGRSYDFYCNNVASSVLHTGRIEGVRYESIGMSGSSFNGMIKEKALDGSIDKVTMDKLFSSIVDGINENGVAISTLVVPRGDKGITTGTNPSKPSITARLVSRVVMDKAYSAKHAIKLLSELNIKQTWGTEYELHWMIADADDTYIVETVNNKLSYLGPKAIDGEPITSQPGFLPSTYTELQVTDSYYDEPFMVPYRIYDLGSKEFLINKGYKYETYDDTGLDLVCNYTENDTDFVEILGTAIYTEEEVDGPLVGWFTGSFYVNDGVSPGIYTKDHLYAAIPDYNNSNIPDSLIEDWTGYQSREDLLSWNNKLLNASSQGVWSVKTTRRVEGKYEYTPLEVMPTYSKITGYGGTLEADIITNFYQTGFKSSFANTYVTTQNWGKEARVYEVPQPSDADNGYYEYAGGGDVEVRSGEYIKAWGTDHGVIDNILEDNKYYIVTTKHEDGTWTFSGVTLEVRENEPLYHADSTLVDMPLLSEYIEGTGEGFNTFEMPITNPTVTPYGAGLERYKIVKDKLAQVNGTLADDKEAMGIINLVQYTNAYKDDTVWYSEFVSHSQGIDNRTDVSEGSAYINGINELKATYQSIFSEGGKEAVRALGAQLGEGASWHSNHQCVYDLANKTMLVYPSENGEHAFRVDVHGVVEDEAVEIE